MCEDNTMQQLLPKHQHNPKIFGTCNCETETKYNFKFEKDNIKERNKRIISLRKQGKTYRAIAEELGISTQRVHQIAQQQQRFNEWETEKKEYGKKKFLRGWKLGIEEFAERLKEKVHKRDYVQGYAEIGLCEDIDETLKECL